MLRWTDFSPWNFRAEDGFAVPSRPSLENIAVQRCYSSFLQGYFCFSLCSGPRGTAQRADGILD